MYEPIHRLHSDVWKRLRLAIRDNKLQHSQQYKKGYAVCYCQYIKRYGIRRVTKLKAEQSSTAITDANRSSPTL